MPKLSSSVTKDFRFHLVPETGKRSIRNVTGECFNVIVNSILIYHSAVSSIWSAVLSAVVAVQTGDNPSYAV